MAPKKIKVGSKGATPPPPPLNPRKFITRVAEDNYNALSVRSLVLERGFLRNNPNFHLFLTIEEIGRSYMSIKILEWLPLCVSFMPISMI